MSEVVRKIANKEALTAQERAIAHAGGSMGGAKPKALIRIDGEEWIIKFFAGEPIDAPLVLTAFETCMNNRTGLLTRVATGTASW